MDFGFLRVAAAIPSVKIADCAYNTAHIEQLWKKADQQQVAVVAFPELSVTGYTCADLFTQPFLLDKAQQALAQLLKNTETLASAAVVGIPIAVGNRIYNCAAVLHRGEIVGLVPKSFIPNYGEFYESRWFAPGQEEHPQQIVLCGQQVPFSTRLLFDDGVLCFGIEVCEDLWVPIPPSSQQALAGANLCINLSASNEMVGKHDYLRGLISQQSARTICAYLYCSAGFGESTTDVVFAGNGLIAENGVLVGESDRFSFEEQLLIRDLDMERLMTQRRKTTTFTAASQPFDVSLGSFRHIALTLPRVDFSAGATLHRCVTPYPFIPNDHRAIDERCSEIFNIQVNGLAQRIQHTHCRSAVIGISGGLDSTLALLVAVRTFDKLQLPRSCVMGVTMPGFGTTGRTYHNALHLMEALGVTIREVSIREACLQHFHDIGLDPADRSVTYENSQARERTQILMDIANQTGGLVVGTGDLSELALGWATYNGDHMSMYGVNAGVPKTLVRYLVGWVAGCEEYSAARAYLLDIIDTPISPELLPADEKGQIAQCTEDLVGPYELHDFYLYHFVRFGYRPAKLLFLATRAFGEKYDRKTLQKWLVTFLRRFFNQQFKRSALPDGPKVGSVSLSPRGDWRMPSDASSAEWLGEAEQL